MDYLTSPYYYENKGASIHVNSLRTDGNPRTSNEFLLLNQNSINSYHDSDPDADINLTPLGAGRVKVQANPIGLHSGGQNSIIGQAIMPSGQSQVTVTTTAVDDTRTRIFLSAEGNSGSYGRIFSWSIVAAGEFIINSNDSAGAPLTVGADCPINWIIFHEN